MRAAFVDFAGGAAAADLHAQSFCQLGNGLVHFTVLRHELKLP